jgi:hypothetical protein
LTFYLVVSNLASCLGNVSSMHHVSTALYVPKEQVRRIRGAGYFKNRPCWKWKAGKKCHKGDKCRFLHGSGDPCIMSHIPYTSRHTDENGVDCLVVRMPLPEAVDKFFYKRGVHIKTLYNAHELKLGGEDCIMFSVSDFHPPDEVAAASAKCGGRILGEDNVTWWVKHHQKTTNNVLYGHGTDIQGALDIALAGKIAITDGRCGNGVYHLGAPADLAEPQAIEHLWEASHKEFTNGGALVISELLGVVVECTVKNSFTDIPPGSKLNIKNLYEYDISKMCVGVSV